MPNAQYKQLRPVPVCPKGHTGLALYQWDQTYWCDKCKCTYTRWALQDIQQAHRRAQDKHWSDDAAELRRLEEKLRLFQEMQLQEQERMKVMPQPPQKKVRLVMMPPQQEQAEEWHKIEYKYYTFPNAWEKMEQAQTIPALPALDTLECWGGPHNGKKYSHPVIAALRGDEAKGVIRLVWPAGAEYRRERLDGQWVLMYYGVEDC